MIKIDNPGDCCGCTACASICPQKAITMLPDALGFMYPVTDESKCTGCGLCKKACSFNSEYERNSGYRAKFYAVRHKNIQEIEKSRSGAMFVAITDHVLNTGGVVYGAGFCNHFEVKHQRATTKEERDYFRGSKYVQSELGDTFAYIKKDLKNGVNVCFSGTPCQTSGLRSFLAAQRINSDKLLTIDIVCHGTPSPFIWRDYLAYIEKKHRGKATAVFFRDKEMLGWAAHKESFTINNQKVLANTYTHLFYQHIMLRHSCAVCPYTNTSRPSDITIADFWGWGNVDQSFNKDDKGVSLVIINSQKGEDIFKAVGNDINAIETTSQTACKQNHPLNRPSDKHIKREQFEKDYALKGFRYVANKYGNTGIFYRMRQEHPIIDKIAWNINNRIINKLWRRRK